MAKITGVLTPHIFGNYSYRNKVICKHRENDFFYNSLRSGRKIYFTGSTGQEEELLASGVGVWASKDIEDTWIPQYTQTDLNGGFDGIEKQTFML